MSDEQFQELRIPRRKFLKRAAATAFVAPVVVSFGLEGVAEASPGRGFDPGHHFGNQFCANQTFSNQFYVVDQNLLVIIGLVLEALHAGQINRWQGTAISEKALSVALRVAADDCYGYDICRLLNALVREIEWLPASGIKTDLLYRAQDAQAAAGCLA